jgi:hypothetical protein
VHEIITTSGTTFSGKIVSESEAFFTIDAGSGTPVKILKKLIKTLDGREYTYNDPSSKTEPPGVVTEPTPQEAVDDTAATSTSQTYRSEESTDTTVTAMEEQEYGTTQSESQWQLQLLSGNVAFELQNMDYKESYNIRPETRGAFAVVHEDTMSFTVLPKSSDYKGGMISLIVTPDDGSIVLHEIEDCKASLEVNSQDKSARLTIGLKPIYGKLTYTTGVVDYTLIRKDEDDGTSDTTLKTEASCMFVVTRGHNYVFQHSKPGFIPLKRDFVFFPDSTYDDSSHITADVTDFMPIRRLVMVGKSALLPGNGQIYGGRRKTGLWYRGLTLSFLGLTVVSGATMGITALVYNSNNEKYPDEPDAGKRREIDESRDRARRYFHHARKAFYISAGTFGVVWTINIIDPIFFSIGKNTRL